MLTSLLIAALLLAITVAIHAVGLALLAMRWLKSRKAESHEHANRFAAAVWRLTRLTWSLLILHAAAISVWALFYVWAGCLPNIESAFYFSGVTYSTVGYGDIVLTEPWRLFGPIEALAGILMCGLSTGFFFAMAGKELALHLDIKD